MGLAPEQVEAVGQGVADTYRAIVGAVVATLSAQVEAALQEGAGWPELLQMADDVRQQAYEQIRDMSKDVRDEVVREVSEALTASLADDLERMGMADELQKVQSATVASAAGTPVQAALGQATAATVSGVMAIVARDNLAMAQDAQSTFLNVSSRYVSLCNAGALSYPDALKRAVSELAERGVGVVEYASGVRNQADVAVLRHLRSQTVQAGNARTMDLCDRCGCKLVEVSSHIGARPSHADWQGQVYRITDDDPELVARYEDFWEATGYEGVKGDHARLGDRLCGVNCRHSFAPYIEGTPRMWSPTPDEDAGLDRDEVYKATQRQRAYERQIRQTKREIAALEDAGADASAKRARLRLQQKRLRTLVSENSEFLRRQSWRESVTGYKATGFKAATHALRMPSSANVRLDTAGLKGAMSRSLVDRQTAAIDASIAKYSVIREAVEKYGMQVKYNPMLVTAVGTTSVDKEAGFVINFAKAPFSSRQTFNSAMKGLVGSYYMPASSKGAESYPGYHEMGHVLLYAMFASQNGRLPTEDEYPAFAQEAKSQILSLMSLAKGSHELSTYAQGLDPSDFAAECFANLNCGKVNAYGDAIRIWIERGGRA